ncbi:MAG: hypothetical protein KDE48_00145 [Anaerolineales bacterium]|nr:hypothetical protein [Anaerolineales bacterium]
MSAITDYLRTREQMAFPPEPDMFHDIFGHLPYLTLNFYAWLEDKFVPGLFECNSSQTRSDQTVDLEKHCVWSGHGK